jgi:hypothetical protein
VLPDAFSILSYTSIRTEIYCRYLTVVGEALYKQKKHKCSEAAFSKACRCIEFYAGAQKDPFCGCVLQVLTRLGNIPEI